MALYTNRDTGSLAYPPGGTTSTLNAAPQATAAPSPVDSFLQKLMEALGQEPESGVAPPMNPQNAPLSPFQYATADYNQFLKPLADQQLQGMFNQRMQAPQMQAQDRVRTQNQRIGQLSTAYNYASQDELRQARIQALQNPAMGMRPGTEGVIQVRRRGPNGEPIRQMMLKSEAIARLHAGEQIEFEEPYAQQVRPGFGPEGAGYYGFDPYKGGGLAGVAPIPSEAAQTNLIQAKAALRGLMSVQSGIEAYSRQAGPIRRSLVDIAGKIPGGSLVTSYFDPQGNITNSSVLLTRQMFVYMLTGKQINPEEMLILEQAFPRVGENITTARPKLQNFFGYLYSILEARNRTAPGLVDPELLSMARTGASGAGARPQSLNDIIEP